MADKKIEEATLAESITGTDVVPAAVGTTPAPRKVTMEQIKNFTIAAIKDIAGLGEGETISADTDFVLTKRAITGGFEEKHVKLSDIAEIINGLLFLETPIPLDGSFLFTMDGGEGNGIFSTPLSDVVDFVRENIGDVMDIDGLDMIETSEIATSTEIPTYPSVGEHNKKITFGAFFNWIHSLFSEQTNSLSGSETFDDTDSILIEKGGVVRKVTRQNSGLTVGGAKAPATTTTGNIPQWGNNSKELTNGLDVVSSVGPASGTGAATDSNVPTEKAVRTAIDAAKGECAKKPAGTTTANYIPQWVGGNNGSLKVGKGINESGTALQDSDSYIPTSKRVLDEITRRAKRHNQIITSAADINITDAKFGDFVVCGVGTETDNFDALFMYTGAMFAWSFISWLHNDVPTESQELSTLFKGRGTTLPTTCDFKSQLFILCDRADPTEDGLYVSTGTASEPQWKKLTYSA